MIDFNIKKCKKAITNIRKPDDKNTVKSKTGSPCLDVKDKNEKHHQKNKFFHSEDMDSDNRVDDNEQTPNENENLPPILMKETYSKKQNLLKPIYAGPTDINEESKTQKDNKLTAEMYEFLYGKAFKNEKNDKKYNNLNLIY